MTDLTPEEKAQRYRRAKEVLDGAGWLFDQFVNNEMASILKTEPGDIEGRERHFVRARIATEMKAGLMVLVDNHAAEVELDERRNRNT